MVKHEIVFWMFANIGVLSNFHTSKTIDFTVSWYPRDFLHTLMKKIASSPWKSKQNQKRQSKKCQRKRSIYRIQNWSEYNQALKQRGNLTVWFSEAVIEKRYYNGPTKQGVQFTYSDLSIQTALIFRSLFRLPFRQTEGFVQSLIQLMGLALDTPDYSILCRRQEVIKVGLDVQNTSDGVHVVVDSTGAKVFGGGE